MIEPAVAVDIEPVHEPPSSRGIRRARGRGDVDEVRPVEVVEELVGGGPVGPRIAHDDVEVAPAVVVHVPPGRAMLVAGRGNAGADDLVDEGQAVVVAVQVAGSEVVIDKDVLEAVGVVVAPRGSVGGRGDMDPQELVGAREAHVLGAGAAGPHYEEGGCQAQGGWMRAAAHDGSRIAGHDWALMLPHNDTAIMIP